MTDLILIIIIVGIVIVAAVFGYNIAQERKFKKEGDARFGSPAKDALLDENSDDFNINADSAIIEDDTNFHVSSMNVEVEEFNDSTIMESFKSELYAKQALSESEVDVAREDFTEKVTIQHTTQLNIQAAEPQETFLDTLILASAPNISAPEISVLDIANSDETVDAAAPNFVLNDKTPILERPADSPEYFSQDIDYIAKYNFNYQITGTKLKSQFAKLGRIKNNYKVFIAATNRKWQLLESMHLEAPYIAAVVGLQMADRGGAVRAEVIEYFAGLSAEIAQQLGAEVIIEPAQDAIERAHQLDEFCMAVDQLVSFNLFEGAGAFTGTKLRGLLEANGFELNTNGLFTHKNESGDVLFAVQAIDGQPFNALMLKTASIAGIKFLLDLPHVKNGVVTFNQMVLVARQMESSLQARLLDEQQKPITEAHIDKIRNQIKMLQDKMTSKHIMPCGDLAKRLFA